MRIPRRLLVPLFALGLPSLCIWVLSLLATAVVSAQTTQRMYRWVDAEGVVHFGDKIPAEYMDIERQVVNEHGVTVEVLSAAKTQAEREEEARQAELAIEQAIQARADQALLSTYLSVDEIKMHRDRRVELFQAQSRVTELYLSNLRKRLTDLEREAKMYKPYSDNPDAADIDPDLVADIESTRDTIDRQQHNLDRFNEEADALASRFDEDIDRFKSLKGLN